MGFGTTRRSPELASLIDRLLDAAPGERDALIEQLSVGEPGPPVASSPLCAPSASGNRLLFESPGGGPFCRPV